MWFWVLILNHVIAFTSRLGVWCLPSSPAAKVQYARPDPPSGTDVINPSPPPFPRMLFDAAPRPGHDAPDRFQESSMPPPSDRVQEL